ncbi:hypothetical protein HNR00_005065 [Methylorubrum rhodinum]|uniref:Uncharacterized protein n=1 Tax=Methylorubrum rhodinum TaxID=29428 RepID=A0A840ZRT2_9HYPH|nr:MULTISPECIES: hypothetical protein [Methylobacteriaceae]MBB5760316.1 hypothetical protein [Methylorubrum rhodinum]
MAGNTITAMETVPADPSVIATAAMARIPMLGDLQVDAADIRNLHLAVDAGFIIGPRDSCAGPVLLIEIPLIPNEENRS